MSASSCRCLSVNLTLVYDLHLAGLSGIRGIELAVLLICTANWQTDIIILLGSCTQLAYSKLITLGQILHLLLPFWLLMFPPQVFLSSVGALIWAIHQLIQRQTLRG